jgi:hypothetical protein
MAVGFSSAALTYPSMAMGTDAYGAPGSSGRLIERAAARMPLRVSRLVTSCSAYSRARAVVPRVEQVYIRGVQPVGVEAWIDAPHIPQADEQEAAADE